MEKYLEIIKNSYSGYFNYLISEITAFHWENYFYGLLIISFAVWMLEILFPWRKNQKIFRKDFWLDTFYLFFNFFLLNLIALIALSNLAEVIFNDILGVVGLSVSHFQLFDVSQFPWWAGVLIFFVIADFVQWATHMLLHRVPFLWNFHKIHHSVKEMGFAAHFRYHWMEPVVYKSILYIPIAIIGGFDIEAIAIVHFFNITIGHLNHANIGWDYGPFKYIFNNPKMHIWHHSKKIPNRYGVNFGITLSLWDYLFKTNYIPYDGRDIELGFEGDEGFPKHFFQQEIYPLNERKATESQ
ncbi:sterol desaturase family protein [Galbibacter sp. EGI 63066]|uniref:sterol desaturase family protein n=1 Tax=Galbibacter sp. EGI 63066 TaxID=2993559 RepID=UPI0022491D7B|nr:sterol desaturase family protein [Galbibacter sp. EGI 63066]MCX2679928.1 sterol desaturase family protein [Galbibacter sp. EGI 63066]